MAKFFVSYTKSDRDWAFWLGKELEALGHEPLVHEWEVAGGADIYAWMERHHDAADHVLCVVSDAYLDAENAPHSALERNAALWQAVKQRPGFVLPIVVKPCKLPTLSDHLKRCELHDLPGDAARTRFRDFISKPPRPDFVPFPGAVAAVSNIPIRVPEHFLGRGEALKAIEAGLARYEGRVAITALHGLRGVGKTVLAAAHADLHRRDYRATWWIRAETESTIRADLVGLGVRLGWVAPEAKEEPALADVMEQLRRDGGGILLIYDNAIDKDTIGPYLPKGGAARVLVTSNAHAWRGIAKPIQIDVWKKKIGADFLIARTGRTGERKAALQLSEMLGGLPLAHEQAAAYCERLEIALAEYARRFVAEPARLLDDEKDAPAEYHDKLTVAKTFALAIEAAAQLHPAAEPLIVHAALLAPEPIPLYLFGEGREQFGDPLSSLLANDGLDESLAALRAFALLDRETIVDERDPAIETETIRLHRLVREVAGARRNGEARGAVLRGLIATMATVYPSRVFNDSDAWPRARRLDALAFDLVGGNLPLPGGTENIANNLISRLAIYRESALADYAGAQTLYERALSISEGALGPEHPDTVIDLSNLATLLQVRGDLAGARPLLERVLAMAERMHGPEHRTTATRLNNLAHLLWQQGALDAALPLFERALTICEKLVGPDHSDTALAVNNLAVVLRAKGQLAAARPLYERALTIRNATLGRDHYLTGTSINNLAILLFDEGNITEARPFFERALVIFEKTLGSDHPNTKLVRRNLAAVEVAIAGPHIPLRRRAIPPSHRS